jgi:hypothetical protein
MATPISTPTPATQDTVTRSYAGPMVLMTLLFLLFGAVTNFNDVLMPYLKDVCQLTDFQSTAVGVFRGVLPNVATRWAAAREARLPTRHRGGAARDGGRGAAICASRQYAGVPAVFDGAGGAGRRYYAFASGSQPLRERAGAGAASPGSGEHRGGSE